MRRGLVLAVLAVLAVLLALVACGAAASANAPRNPLVLVLRPADFPAKADPVDAGPMPSSFARKLRAIGAVGRAAQYFASIPFGPERSQHVAGLVVVTPSAAEARKVYAWQERTAMRLVKGASALRLPRLGDEQVALANGDADSGRLLVRRNAVVWRLEVSADGELSLSPPRVRDELVKYAETQQERIGKG
jgi:hypothetical protein